MRFISKADTDKTRMLARSGLGFPSYLGVDYSLEPARTSGGTCRYCRVKVKKGEPVLYISMYGSWGREQYIFHEGECGNPLLGEGINYGY